MLWQGAPSWRGLAWRVLHLREVAIYFAMLIAWFAFSAVWTGAGVQKALYNAAVLLIPGLVAAGLLGFIAWLSAGTTLYTITSKRIVMRIGIVLPTTFNIPYAQVTSADAALRRDGTGDISVKLASDHIAYLVLWPHARPWRLRNPEPAMRELPDAARVASLLADALRTANGQPAAAPSAPMSPARPARAVKPRRELSPQGGLSAAGH
jgi:hypothetical protein